MVTSAATAAEEEMVVAAVAVAVAVVVVDVDDVDDVVDVVVVIVVVVVVVAVLVVVPDSLAYLLSNTAAVIRRRGGKPTPGPNKRKDISGTDKQLKSFPTQLAWR